MTETVAENMKKSRVSDDAFKAWTDLSEENVGRIETTRVSNGYSLLNITRLFKWSVHDSDGSFQ